MDIELLLPYVLEFVDTDRLGPRAVAMLELVYELQAGKACSVHLGPKELRKHGRTKDQAKYDTKVLDRLVDAGMLRKVSGRGRIANGYSLREPKLWDTRVIRWEGRRDRLLAYFSGLEQGDLILLRGETAGGKVLLWGGAPGKQAPLRGDLSVTDRPATELDRPATELRPGVLSKRSPRYGNEAAAFSQLHEGSIDPSSSCEEEEEADQVESAVAKAIAQTIGKQDLWKGSAPRAQVATTVRQHPGRRAELLALVPLLAGIQGPPQAAAAFDQLATEHAVAGWPGPGQIGGSTDVGAKIRGLERLIRTVEEHNPEDEKLEELQAELAALTSQIAS